MGRFAGLLLQTIAKTGHEAAYAYGQTQITAPRRRNGSGVEGCKPCEAAKRVDDAVARFTGGGVSAAPGRGKKKPARGVSSKRAGGGAKRRGVRR